jgi:predicted  nucleic acid-binding Zn-ribbon protein
LDEIDVQNPNLYDEGNFNEEAQDQVGEMPEHLESASEMKPTQSQLSQMSGKTYISQLKKQLDEEREARNKLEGELEDLKKISSEITSHLSLI